MSAARPRRQMKLRPGVAHSVQRPGQEMTSFAPYVPAPGVAPKSALALDSAEQTVYAWATQASLAYGEGLAFLGYPYLTQLAQRPEFRQISTIWAKEMTRRWIKITSAGGTADEEKIKIIEAAMRKFRIRDAFRNATLLDGFFGRSHVFIDLGPCKAGELETPLVLDPRKIRPDSFRGLRVVEPAWVYPNAYNTAQPLDENYYRPRDWFVMGDRVHRSRLMTFVSQPVPDLLKPSYSFGGLSRTQQAMPYVDNWIRTRQSVSDLLHSFSKTILKTNMSAILQGGGADALNERAALYAATRDNKDLIMVDMTDEDIVDVSTPLGTLDKLQAQSQEQMSSIAGIPLVVLLGITPSGLNASSDGEIKTFYAAVKAAQEDLFTDPLNVVLAVLQLSLFGSVDPNIGFEYLPLWEDDDTARAGVQKTMSEIDTTYLDAGVVSPEEVRERLANDPESPYSGLDLSAPPPEPPEPDVPDDGSELPAQDSEFRESDHPRADNGQFGEGGGSYVAPPFERAENASAISREIEDYLVDNDGAENTAPIKTIPFENLKTLQTLNTKSKVSGILEKGMPDGDDGLPIVAVKDGVSYLAPKSGRRTPVRVSIVRTHSRPRRTSTRRNSPGCTTNSTLPNRISSTAFRTTQASGSKTLSRVSPPAPRRTTSTSKLTEAGRQSVKHCTSRLLTNSLRRRRSTRRARRTGKRQPLPCSAAVADPANHGLKVTCTIRIVPLCWTRTKSRPNCPNSRGGTPLKSMKSPARLRTK
ncbi:MAG: DUF1073 domain-containing protein [Caulobacteraceae bacterium]|nr:DUF1073 domain-containing protein [Caulobacteraceae bacterium]